MNTSSSSVLTLSSVYSSGGYSSGQADPTTEDLVKFNIMYGLTLELTYTNFNMSQGQFSSGKYVQSSYVGEDTDQANRTVNYIFKSKL